MTASRYDRAAIRFRGLAPLAGGMALAIATLIGIWLVALFYLPPLNGMEEPFARLAFALKCVCLAVLFCFLTAIEAVSHERLQSDAFDPLAGHTTQRLNINLRYLQNTLEQLALFVPGVLVLALDAEGGGAMREVIAATTVWIIARIAFWIGYHFGPQYRVFGLAGMAQSMLVLLYVSARFGDEIAGPVGAATPVVIFLIVEAFLVLKTRARPRMGNGA